MGRTAAAGTSYNANSLSHFAATANATVWPPPANAANQLRGQITELLRRNAGSEDGVSLRSIDAVLRGFSLVDIDREIIKMADEGQHKLVAMAVFEYFTDGTLVGYLLISVHPNTVWASLCVTGCVWQD